MHYHWYGCITAVPVAVDTTVVEAAKVAQVVAPDRVLTSTPPDVTPTGVIVTGTEASGKYGAESEIDTAPCDSIPNNGGLADLALVPFLGHSNAARLITRG